MLIDNIILVASWADKSMLQPDINLIGKPIVRATEDHKCQLFLLCRDRLGRIFTNMSIAFHWVDF